MDDNVVFVRTAKGRAAAAGMASSQLVPLLRILLALINGKSTVGDLQQKVADEIPLDKFRSAIEELLSDGYIESAGSPAPEDNDLDFTRLGSPDPGPQPTREQLADAVNKTLPGMRELRRAGCYVNIANRPTQRIPPRSGGKYGVLIIDSDQGASLLFARTLMLVGFDVRSAANSQEIIAELKKPPLPDVILLDTAFPGLNGLDFLARIHQHPQLATIPIVVITSKLEQDEVADALARGASAYMIKPCMPQALLDCVHAVLGLK